MTPVSILARPFERALPWVWVITFRKLEFQSSPALSSGRYDPVVKPEPGSSCFNPRPPFRAGATFRRAQGRAGSHVSILARPFERALRWIASPTRGEVHVSILARPFERALHSGN